MESNIVAVQNAGNRNQRIVLHSDIIKDIEFAYIRVDHEKVSIEPQGFDPKKGSSKKAVFENKKANGKSYVSIGFNMPKNGIYEVPPGRYELEQIDSNFIIFYYK